MSQTSRYDFLIIFCYFCQRIRQDRHFTVNDHINSCCYQHDTCYDAQSGQKFCDDTFCSCLERRSRSSKSCHDESSPLFCDLVRTFGDDAYKASAPNATTTDEGLVEVDEYYYESHVKNATIA
uniref:Phospholipase A(2) n=1 Tax=Caenorhabditis japonica TaxID=281687 RepID=A0A8R1HJN7_CAEJA